MYAIVEINGQQFKAEAGQKLFVHHIEGAENGSTVEFEKVLLVDKDGNVTVGAPTVEGAKVVCQVISNLVKGDKVLVFHKKCTAPSAAGAFYCTGGDKQSAHHFYARNFQYASKR